MQLASNWYDLVLIMVEMRLLNISAAVSLAILVVSCKGKEETVQVPYTVSCGVGNVATMLNQGWKVVSSSTREVQCGTKTVIERRATGKGPMWTNQYVNIPRSVPNYGTATEYILEGPKSLLPDSSRMGQY